MVYIVFYSTSDVFEAEEKLTNVGISVNVVPTPVTDRAYCGVCLKVDRNSLLNVISDMEYKIIEEE